MKLKSIQVQNLGPVEDKTITINQPLTVVLGQPEAGKSTILHSVVWAGGGEFPADILRHGCEEGFVELVFDNATIRREFYRAKDNTTKARQVKYTVDNKVQDRPVEKIKALLNPFLLDPKFFEKKNEKDRRLYLLDVLGVDTTAEDAQIKALEETAKAKRQLVDRLGERAEPADMEVPNVNALQLIRQSKQQEWQLAVNAKAERQRQIDAALVEQAALRQKMDQAQQMRADVKTRLEEFSTQKQTQALEKVSAAYQADIQALNADAERRIKVIQEELRIRLAARSEKWTADSQTEAQSFVAAHDRAVLLSQRAEAMEAEVQEAQDKLEIPAELPEPVLDTSAIDAQIAAAGTAQAQHLAYVAYKDWHTEKNDAQTGLRTATASLELAREAKRTKLSELAGACSIKGMTFDTEGNPVFEGTTMDMLSDSQAQRLSSAIAALYPAGIGIELVDGGERFGKRIVEYIDYAKANSRNVLMSVVGDKLAVENDEIGVFVIEKK